MMVRSFLFVPLNAVTQWPSEPKGLGSILTISHIFFLLCFIKRRYDKEEFDTDCSQGFLKSLNEILCSVILEKRKVFASVRNSLSNIILQEKNSILTYNSWIRAFSQIISLLFPSIRNCFMCWLSFTSNEYF